MTRSENRSLAEARSDPRTIDEEVELAQTARKKRRRPILPLALLIAVLTITGGTLAYLRQPAKPLTVDAALARYRSATSASGSASADEAAVNPAASSPAPATPEGVSPSQPPDAGAAGVPAAGGGVTGAGGAPARTSDRSRGGARPGRTPQPEGRTQSTDSTIKRPAPGVYTFDTTGYEQTDALGGARHDYPAQTALTVKSTACGFTQRWQPLNERWDESEHCIVANGIDIRRFTTYHSFFQKSIEQTYPCPAGSLVYNVDTTAGKQWGLRCSGDAGTVDMKIHNVGWQDLLIAGKPVRTLHIRYDSVMTGANRGTQAQDRWFDPQSGMNVRIDTDIKTESDSPFGVIHYTEHYSITAASLQPQT